MKTPPQIHLPCRHSCDQSHDYKYDRHAVQALEVQWYYPNVHKQLLDKIPEQGKAYTLRLNPPLRLSTKEPFWAVYLPLIPYWNGIETEADIKELRFCLCRIIRMAQGQDRTAFLKVKVEQVLGLDDAMPGHNPSFQWLSLLQDEKNHQTYGHSDNFKDYSFVSISIQGDLGIDAIVKKEHNRCEIVALHEWDFHLNSWSLCSIALSEAEEAKYGISYEPNSGSC